ncbi:MAG: hypothetical protein U9N37_02090 [Thermodesulfobacteriota bacterium]|nr:hypothetical protein [Thermodesulfobacteriota bacterium]
MSLYRRGREALSIIDGKGWLLVSVRELSGVPFSTLAVVPGMAHMLIITRLHLRAGMDIGHTKKSGSHQHIKVPGIRPTITAGVNGFPVDGSVFRIDPDTGPVSGSGYLAGRMDASGPLPRGKVIMSSISPAL